jgi:hypothetical protein
MQDDDKIKETSLSKEENHSFCSNFPESEKHEQQTDSAKEIDTMEQKSNDVLEMLRANLQKLGFVKTSSGIAKGVPLESWDLEKRISLAEYDKHDAVIHKLRGKNRFAFIKAYYLVYDKNEDPFFVVGIGDYNTVSKSYPVLLRPARFDEKLELFKPDLGCKLTDRNIIQLTNDATNLILVDKFGYPTFTEDLKTSIESSICGSFQQKRNSPNSKNAKEHRDLPPRQSLARDVKNKQSDNLSKLQQQQQKKEKKNKRKKKKR